MEESKVVQANEKVADTVTAGYQKVEDAFVDRYLTRDGESTADAKARLAAEKDARQKERN